MDVLFSLCSVSVSCAQFFDSSKQKSMHVVLLFPRKSMHLLEVHGLMQLFKPFFIYFPSRGYRANSKMRGYPPCKLPTNDKLYAICVQLAKILSSTCKHIKGIWRANDTRRTQRTLFSHCSKIHACCETHISEPI
jgi:hypothetical protein